MSVGYILLWLVGISAFSLIARTIRSRGKRSRGWVLTAALILVAMASGAWRIDPDFAGFVGAGLWFLLVMVPSFGLRLAVAWTSQQRFRRSRYLSYFLILLHPADGYLELPRLFKALEDTQRGKPLDFYELISKFSTMNSMLGRAASVYLYTFAGKWTELLNWLQANFSFEELEQDPALFTSYLRALGETRQLNELVYFYETRGGALHQLGPSAQIISEMFVLAFTGRAEAVERLLKVTNYPKATQTYWLATAEMAAGNPSAGEFRLRTLGTIDDARIRGAVERRLADPFPAAAFLLNEATRARIDHIEQLPIEVRVPPPPPAPRYQGICTKVLVVLNLIVFGLEMLKGGSTDEEVLFELGALLPEAVLAGQWWRLINATFLHYGLAHLAMNMFALFVIGPFVETSLRRLGFLACYFFAGIGSMATVTTLVYFNVLHHQFLVGASGAISGLIGATGALLLNTWRKERTQNAYNRLTSIGFAVLIQVAFDLTTRQVSFTAHFSGAILGFLYTVVYLLIRKPAASGVR